ncbi:MAG: hypothetical protein ACNI3C_08260 [Candidatus Marinarcus sp.]
MSKEKLKPKIPLIKTSIVKQPSVFAGGKPGVPSKITTNKDAYKRV